MFKITIQNQENGDIVLDAEGSTIMAQVLEAPGKPIQSHVFNGSWEGLSALPLLSFYAAVAANQYGETVGKQQQAQLAKAEGPQLPEQSSDSHRVDLGRDEDGNPVIIRR